MLFQLRQGRFLEHAALLAGVSSRVLSKWIELGRKNTPGFVEFTNAIDRADAELGDKLMGGIMTCIEDGDASSMKWLYEKRMGLREKHMQAKWLKVEDDAYAGAEQNGEVSVQSLEDAEKELERVMLLADEGELQ